MIYFSLVCLNALAFLIYGVSCLVTTKMKNEFIRFGIPNFRLLTGLLQIAGGLGILLGYWFNQYILLIASGGLSFLMLSGFIVRLKIKDSIPDTIPAFSFCVLNGIIAYKTYLLL